MRVTFLGQAGLFIETRAGSILCDPWFSPAYFGSWFPFPANDGIDPALIGSPTYLYISHLHHDHFDPAWLSEHVSKDATVLLPDYLIDDLRHELHGLGFRRFVETADGEPIELAGGLKVMIEALTAPTDGPIGDSALLVDDGQTRVLNMNDSRPPDPDKLLALGPIDLLFLQFSGAIWYPMVYEFPERAKITLAHKKRVVQLARAQRYIEIIDPAFVVPSAGPPCFLDDDLFEYNDLRRDPANIFPDQEVFLDYLAEAGIGGGRLMLPGSAGELTPSSFDVSHPVPEAEVRRIFDQREPYLREYQARIRPLLDAEHARWARGGAPLPDPGAPDSDEPLEPLDLVAELKAWFEPLMGFGELTCSGIGAPVLLDLRGPQGLAAIPEGQPAGIVLDFVDQLVRPWDGVETPRYIFRIDRPLIEVLVREHEVDWVNSLFLSMRFRAARKGPYNEYVYTWFKCLDLERLQYAEGFYAEKAKSEGSFVLDGWEIQRRCPHMKADLTRFATIEKGVLTCSLHGWQYELASGRCLTSEGHEITARALSPEELVALEAAAVSGEATVAAVAAAD
ncbi:MAG TPA: Rieske 2Fe-2S domain-containing protein [Candidatus Limnocylindrales bacterium]|nr:Rieske 2Fe-2S domain-containing protein [Candidatus Limnocylindrales bacterium]